ncbi:MAG: PAS-domain containing protein [Rhodospirillales bacterium]|nr:PAS-domain containing protein [Rhodospirillales bacterium]
MAIDLAAGAGDPDARARKLNKIIKVLMDQVERGIDVQGNAYSLFQTAIVLEDRVRERTRNLEIALRELGETNSELSLAKEQTEAVQTRLMEAIESISEGFLHCDGNDRFVLCNQKFLEFWPGIDAVARPGAPFSAISRWTVETGLVADLDLEPETWLQRRLHWHRRPSEPIVVHLRSGRWLQIRERFTRDGGIVGIYTDISEVKVSEERRRERELAEKSVLLQSTLDNLMQGVSVFDRDLRLVAWNDQFIDLLELPDWLVEQGAALTDYLRFRAERGDYGSNGLAAAAARLEAARQRRPLQNDQVLPSGRVLEVRRDPMPDGGFVTTYTDITERKESAEALREAKEGLERRVAERTAELTALNGKLRQEIFERAKIEEALRVAKGEAEVANLSKTKFLAAASHDLLQPLNAARLFVAALLERPLGEKESEFAGRIDGALKSVEALLATLLDISKFDAGAVTVDRVAFDIADMLSSLEQEYAPVAREAGLEFRVISCSAVILSDSALLARIVRNFVSNAIRYTPSGRVLLGCRRCGRMLRIEIWDTGLGIPEASIGEIFHEFRQLGNRHGREKGVGLGLAIVQRIARTLGHPIAVRSSVNRGSVFAVEVPLGSGTATPKRRGPSATAVTSSLAGILIAVIENDDVVSEGMRVLLEGWGCDVITAADGDGALAQANRLRRLPDLLVADYHLERGDTGVDAIDRLRAVAGAMVPGIVITADRSSEVLRQVRSRGFYLLNKPIRPAKLRALMSHILT